MQSTKKPPRRTVLDRVKHLGPCEESRTWMKAQTNSAKAWKVCERGDWMLWLLGKCAGEPKSDARKALVLCCCECARLALPYTKDPRVLACIETAERWARGEATIEQLRKARQAAYAAYAADAAADAAAYAAAYAADADAAYAAAYAAYAAAYAAYADAYAAADAAAYAARAKTLAKCAAIVRKHYPKPPQL